MALRYQSRSRTTTLTGSPTKARTRREAAATSKFWLLHPVVLRHAKLSYAQLGHATLNGEF